MRPPSTPLPPTFARQPLRWWNCWAGFLWHSIILARTLSTTAFDDGIAALQRYSLIKRNVEEQTYSMHRLVQAVLIDDMSNDLQKQWRKRIARALNAAFPLPEFKDWARCGRLLPHALACFA